MNTERRVCQLRPRGSVLRHFGGKRVSIKGLDEVTTAGTILVNVQQLGKHPNLFLFPPGNDDLPRKFADLFKSKLVRKGAHPQEVSLYLYTRN